MPEHTPAPSPSRAVYGFVFFLAFKVFFQLYAVWALFPPVWFYAVGITCLPRRYWAVTVPIFLIFALGIFAFVIYPHLRYFMTPKANDLRTMCDTKRVQFDDGGQGDSKPEIGDCKCKNRKKCWKTAFDASFTQCTSRPNLVLGDLNIWDVSNHLYKINNW